MTNTKSIKDLIEGYANSEDSSFLIPNATEDFLAVRPSGNPISAKGLVGTVSYTHLTLPTKRIV